MVSFGQDPLDSLFYSVSMKHTKTRYVRSLSLSPSYPSPLKEEADIQLNPPTHLRHLTTNFLVATCYVLAHAILLFIHIVTLFVAVNSADQALLTLLISNNFAEMKSSVFKRYVSSPTHPPTHPSHTPYAVSFPSPCINPPTYPPTHPPPQQTASTPSSSSNSPARTWLNASNSSSSSSSSPC